MRTQKLLFAAAAAMILVSAVVHATIVDPLPVPAAIAGAAQPAAAGAPAATGDAAERRVATSDPTPAARADHERRAVGRRETAPAVELCGRVVDEHGDAVGGADVLACVRTDLRSLRDRQAAASIEVEAVLSQVAASPPLRARTRDDGRFSLRVPAPSAAALVVEIGVARPGFAPHVERRKGRVDAGVLQLGTVAIARGIVLAGRVVDDRGVPVGDAFVDACSDLPANGGIVRALRERATSSVRTDAGGYFEVHGVPARGARLTVQARHYNQLRTDPFAGDGRERVDCGTLTLVRGTAIEGIVVDARGAAVAGATVEVTRSRHQLADLLRGVSGDALGAGQLPTVPVTTRADGRFVLPGVPPVRLSLTVRHGQFAAATIDPLVPGDSGDVRVVLSSRLELQGVVVDGASGQPLERFALRARPVAATSSIGTGAMPLAPPQRYPSGRFSLRDLGPGTYAIDIQADGYARTSIGPVALHEGAAPVRIALDRGVIVAGLVTDEHTGEPVVGASVELYAAGREAARDAVDPRRLFSTAFAGRTDGACLVRTRTGRDGKAELGTHRPGHYRVVVAGEDHLPSAPRAVFVDGDEIVVEVAVARGACVSGIVRDIESRPAALLLQQVDGARRRAAIAADGRYRIDNLAAGRCSLWLEVAGVAVELPSIVVPAGGQLRHDLSARAARPASLRGAVARNGRPAAGYRVHVEPVPSQAVPSQATPRTERLAGLARRLASPATSASLDDDGTFRFDLLAPGSYVLEVRGRGGAVLHREELALSPGERGHLDVSVQLGGITFDVRDPRGASVAAVVQVVRADEASELPPSAWRGLRSHRRAMVRPGGAIEDLAPGRWRYAVIGGGAAAVEVVAGRAVRVAVRIR